MLTYYKCVFKFIIFISFHFPYAFQIPAKFLWRYRERRSGPRRCPGPLGAPVSGSEGPHPCAPPGRKLGWGLEGVTLWNRLGQLSTLSGKTGVSVDEKNDLVSPLLWVVWGEGRKKMVPAKAVYEAGVTGPPHRRK